MHEKLTLKSRLSINRNRPGVRKQNKSEKTLKRPS
jgi:hypothetical protein